MIKKNNGLIMVNFYSGFINKDAVAASLKFKKKGEEFRKKYSDDKKFREAVKSYFKGQKMPRGSVNDVADHIDHIVKIAGVDHVGFGADYDGVGTLPDGLEDVSTFPTLIKVLKSRGYSDTDLAKIQGENFYRVLSQAEKIAASANSKAH